MADALSASVLVLNKHYSPINITNARRAFSMLFNSIAEVITVEDEGYFNYNFSSWAEFSEYKKMLEDGQDHEWVHTPSLILMVPRVVRLHKYDRVRTTKVRLTRRNIYYRDNNVCQYCGKRFKTRDLNVDHVIPRSRGGKDTWHNLVCACVSCNIRKGNRTPHEAGMRLIKEPVRPKLNPLILLHIGNKKYASWKSFLNEAYWNVELQD
jgi:5-methylcytosine-specific restriction endonuclease McrA